MELKEMNEIVTNEEWLKLIDDCKGIIYMTIQKVNYVNRKELLEGRYLLGKRILESLPLLGTPQLQEDLAKALEIKQQRISEVMSFAKYIDKHFGSVDGLVKYYSEHNLPELPTWTEITHTYLPFNELPKELEYEDKEDMRLVDKEIPISHFASVEQAKKYYEDKGGVLTYYKGKVKKRWE